VAHAAGAALGGQRLYVDGVWVTGGAKAASDFTAQTGINIGFGSGGYLNGAIDEVALYARVLTPAEIAALAVAPFGDGAGDACDCIPKIYNPTTWAPLSGPATNLRASGGPTTALTWLAPAPATGAGTPLYDLLRSTAASSFLSGTCLGSNQAGTSGSDSTASSAFYLVRAENACGGIIANGSGGAPVAARSCP
jgi:hypothetical protein